jgi:hypothetical protein
MSAAESRALLQIDPSALGPLGDVPHSGGEPAVVFAGEERFLSARHVWRRLRYFLDDRDANDVHVVVAVAAPQAPAPPFRGRAPGSANTRRTR